MPNNQKHKHYVILNLFGYGLSKFNEAFLQCYGFESKTALYKYCVDIGMTDTPNSVKTRQDEFDSVMPESPRAGWHNKDGTIRKDYQDRKDFIDSFYGTLDVDDFVSVVKMAVAKEFGEMASERNAVQTQQAFPVLGELLKGEKEVKAKPIIQSCFKKMQVTGYTAECYFWKHYRKIDRFLQAEIEDARLFGDGYDFQLTLPNLIYLAEVKGLQTKTGSIRMTQNEYEKAQEYNSNYALIIVSNLQDIPEFKPIFNPAAELRFEKCSIKSEQIFYRTGV
jgi:hypothetical protein